MHEVVQKLKRQSSSVHSGGSQLSTADGAPYSRHTRFFSTAVGSKVGLRRCNMPLVPTLPSTALPCQDSHANSHPG